MWKQWLNFILGLLVIVLAYSGGSMIGYIVLGIVIALVALWAALEKKGMMAPKV